MKPAAKYQPNVEIAAEPENLARRCVELFAAHARSAIESRSAFYAAISGGNTPRRFFELLGRTPESKALPWNKIQLFWVDERYVPPDSDRSNYKLAADTFLGKVDIPRENIHRIPTEYSDFNEAVRAYEAAIRQVFGLKEGAIPRFDLIVLGMGVEGHTGSLFPNSYAPFDQDNLACVVYSMDERLNRVTLTHSVLCAAAHLVVLVAGQEKAHILKQVLSSEPDEVRYPIHALWPVLDRVTWLVDQAAAKLLSP